MKSVLICILFCCLSGIDAIRFGRKAPPKVENLDDTPDYYFDQILDHTADSKTHWSQRYFMSDKYWKGDTAPIFLFIEGEGEASPSWLQDGAWVDWASEFGAMLYILEHRFYGKSHPTSDVSTDNLKSYLNSQQAVADIAYFIQQTNDANNYTSNKWILFGGSYPGNLVAWSRLKYPDLVYGSISSSGPLQAKLDFPEYSDVVGKSLDYFSPGCAGEVTKAIKEVQKMLKTHRGVNNLSSKIEICEGFGRHNKEDRSALIESITGFIGTAVQENQLDSESGIGAVCRYMNNKTISDPLDRLAEAYNNISGDCASGNYASSINYYNKTNWDDDSVSAGDRQWFFQTCNEFGYFQTSETRNSLFSDSLPVDYFTKKCTAVLGSEFNPEQLQKAVDDTNNYFEGTDIVVKRVVFVQGTIDPWHALGMVKNPTKDDPLYLVKGTTHCDDMDSASSTDPPELTKARKNIEKYLTNWLSM